MSLLEYNYVTLPFCDTSSFRQESIRDESDTDQYLTKVDLQVQCVITSDYLAAITKDIVPPPLMQAGVPITENAATIMSVIRSQLLQPRKPFHFTFNGASLLPERRAGMIGVNDARNGPVPQSCTIIELTNSCFIINFHIIAHYWEANTVAANGVITNQLGNDIILNRWTESIELDSAQFIRKTREGKWIIRGDNAAAADRYRTAAAGVGVAPGFIRESSRYSISPDGLTVSYRVTDKEVFKMPPQPAYEADGTYTETTTTQGAIRFGEIRLKFKGSKNTSHAVLTRIAVATAAQKLKINGTRNKLVFAALSIGMYDNWVECAMKVQYAAGLIGGSKNLTVTPGSTGITPTNPRYRSYGTSYAANSNMMLKAAAYYDPSLRGVQLNGATGQLTQGTEPGTGR